MAKKRAKRARPANQRLQEEVKKTEARLKALKKHAETVHDAEILGERIRRIRKEREWSQRRLLDELELVSGHSYSTAMPSLWEGLERGVSLAAAIDLAAAFGLTMDEFLEGVYVPRVGGGGS